MTYVSGPGYMHAVNWHMRCSDWEQRFLFDADLHTPPEDGSRSTSSFKKRKLTKSRNQVIIIMIKADKLTNLSISSICLSQACSMKTSQIVWIYQDPRYTFLLDTNSGTGEYPTRISGAECRTELQPLFSVRPAVNFTPKSCTSPLKMNSISNTYIRHSVH